MSRSHHNAYSQHQHHHSHHQSSWFMSPNIVNSLFCSPPGTGGSSGSANCSNTFLNGANINNHLTNLLNAQHNFLSSSQLGTGQQQQQAPPQSQSQQQQPFIANNFSSHYHGAHPHGFSMFPPPGSGANGGGLPSAGGGSSSRFIAGQNNHHYQGSPNYSSRSNNRGGSRGGGLNFNPVSSDFGGHSRRYQSSGYTTSNSPVLSMPPGQTSFLHSKSTAEFNLFNDLAVRHAPAFHHQQQQSGTGSKDAKSPGCVHLVSKHSHKSAGHGGEPDQTNTASSSGSKHSLSTPGPARFSATPAATNPHIKGMENIKLDNEGGTFTNYSQVSKQSSTMEKEKEGGEQVRSGQKYKFHHDSVTNSNLDSTNLKKSVLTGAAAGGEKASSSSSRTPALLEEDLLVLCDNELVELAKEGDTDDTSVGAGMAEQEPIESDCTEEVKRRRSKLGQSNCSSSSPSSGMAWPVSSVSVACVSSVSSSSSMFHSQGYSGYPPGMMAPMAYPLGGPFPAGAYLAAQQPAAPRCQSLYRGTDITISMHSYHDICSSKLWQYYVTNRQTEVMYVRKVQLRNALHMVMSYVFENAGLFIVGSSMNGFGSDNSDMDLCLTISSKELDQKKEAFVVLNQLVEPLRKCSFIKNLQLIRATVPILKFRDSLAAVDCDLNINNVVGIYNTHLMAMYNRIDWRVRPLGMYIKHWAQKLDIHDASRGRLSTYTLILMVIQYLQAGCQPPVLPSLQMRFPSKFSYERQIKEVDMRLELPWEELRSANTARLSDLLMGFFEYYADRFDFARMVVSVRQGKPLPIDVAIKQLPAHEQLHNVKSFKMFIEEPFSLTNVARSLFDGLVFSRVKCAFRHSLQVMRLKQSLKTIFTLPLLPSPAPCANNMEPSGSGANSADNSLAPSVTSIVGTAAGTSLTATVAATSPPAYSISSQDDLSKTTLPPISDNSDNTGEEDDEAEEVVIEDEFPDLDNDPISSSTAALHPTPASSDC